MAGAVQASGDKVATRAAYGKALVELGQNNSDVVVLDADLSGSTQTKHFAKEFPERFFNMGIAEANMMSTAAGMARMGKIPFASSFAMFASGRAWEQVRNSIAHNYLNVKVCATHSGITVGEDGASHQTIEDIAIMKVIPTMTVIVPADATETTQVINAVAAHNGPCYVRLGRMAVPVSFDPDTYEFQIGKANVVREGSDLTIVACGVMVGRAIEAAKELSQEGISVEVINSASIKPFDYETIVASAKKTGKVISAEEHNIIGGLGESVAAAIAEAGVGAKLHRLGINDTFGQSGKAEELLDHYGLSASNLVKLAKDMI